jgi:hypothetical protein
MMLKNLFVAILGLSLLTTAALAQRGRRSNMGGAMRGRLRADQVQGENNGPSKGSKSKKTRTREGWERNAQHKAKGRSK